MPKITKFERYNNHKTNNSVSYTTWWHRIRMGVDMEKALERRLKNYNWNEDKTFRLPAIPIKLDKTNIITNQEEYKIILKAYNRQIEQLEEKEQEEGKELLNHKALDELIEEKDLFVKEYSQFARGV